MAPLPDFSSLDKSFHKIETTLCPALVLRSPWVGAPVDPGWVVYRVLTTASTLNPTLVLTRGLCCRYFAGCVDRSGAGRVLRRDPPHRRRALHEEVRGAGEMGGGQGDVGQGGGADRVGFMKRWVERGQVGKTKGPERGARWGRVRPGTWGSVVWARWAQGGGADQVGAGADLGRWGNQGEVGKGQAGECGEVWPG